MESSDRRSRPAARLAEPGSATYLVFGRTEYAEPLSLVTTVEADSQPSLDDLDVVTGWLELVLVPADEIIWILRDGETVAVGAGQTT